MAIIENGNRNLEMQQAERIIRENLKDEIAKADATRKQAKALEDIVDLALAALQDHQPALSAVLMKKAKQIFGNP